MKWVFCFFLLVAGLPVFSSNPCQGVFERLNAKEEGRAFVLGGGSYGTAFAQVLSHNFKEVIVFNRRQDVSEKINQLNASPNLPEIPLSSRVVGMNRWDQVKDLSLIVLSVPIQNLSKALKENHDNLVSFIKQGIPIVSLSKGISTDGSLFVQQIISREFPFVKKNQIYILSGPSFAAEMASDQHTLVNLSGFDLKGLRSMRELISTDRFKVEITTDMAGVSFAGAAKNIIAIASGLGEGLGLGHNGQTALILKLNKELMEIGRHLQVQEKTFWSPSYFGDLLLSLNKASRNARFGLAIGKGESPEHFFENNKISVEGFGTVKALYARVKAFNEKPIVIPEIESWPVPAGYPSSIVSQKIVAPLFTVLFNILYNKEKPERILDYL